MGRSGYDGPLLPGQGGGFRSAERPPEGKLAILERAEGKQIMRLKIMADPADSPGASPAMAFVFTSRDGLYLCAGRTDGPFRARIMRRYLPPPRIWTRDWETMFGPRGPFDPPDELQRELEGQIMVGLAEQKKPNHYGGESIVAEFRSGARLILKARRSAKVIYQAVGPPWVYRADLEWILDAPERPSTVILPGRIASSAPIILG